MTGSSGTGPQDGEPERRQEGEPDPLQDHRPMAAGPGGDVVSGDVIAYDAALPPDAAISTDPTLSTVPVEAGGAPVDADEDGEVTADQVSLGRRLRQPRTIV